MRSTREELIRRGIIKVEELQDCSAGTVGDGGMVLGERIYSELVTML